MFSIIADKREQGIAVMFHGIVGNDDGNFLDGAPPQCKTHHIGFKTNGADILPYLSGSRFVNPALLPFVVQNVGNG